MHEWLSETLTGHVAEVPPFDQIISDIKRQRWIAPRMPEDALAPVDDVAPALAPAETTAPRSAAPRRSNVVHATEAELRQDIVPIIPGFEAGKFIAANGVPPKTDQGQAMCLAFHVAGKCYRNCRRRDDHCKHNDADAKKLAKYLATTPK